MRERETERDREREGERGVELSQAFSGRKLDRSSVSAPVHIYFVNILYIPFFQLSTLNPTPATLSLSVGVRGRERGCFALSLSLYPPSLPPLLRILCRHSVKLL